MVASWPTESVVLIVNLVLLGMAVAREEAGGSLVSDGTLNSMPQFLRR